MLLGTLRSLVNGFQQNTSSDVSSPRPRGQRERGAYRWLYKNIFSTFRYGMVLLYVGTLLIVIGYHNPSIIFARYIGMVLVVVGLLCIGGAIICGFQRYIFGEDNDFNSEPDRAESTDSKRSLPTYDNAINMDLPTYEEAMILKEADDTRGQTHLNPSERPGVNQQLTLWPSIGHYSSRISPIAEVEEHVITSVAHSTQTAATISHGGQIIPTSVSPPVYQESVVWNTGLESLPIQDDGSIELLPENHFPASQRINLRWKQRNKRRRDNYGVRNETRAELILSPSFSRSPIDRPSTVLPILTFLNETRFDRERNVTSSFPPEQQMETDSGTIQDVTGHVNEASSEVPYTISHESSCNRDDDEPDDPSVVYADPQNPQRVYFDGLGGQSRSNSILTRPRTSVTRPGTAATLFLESCSTSLYSEASFDDDSSSILSDWDDLPSIESLGSQTNQQACAESDLILENFDVGNVEDENHQSSVESSHSSNVTSAKQSIQYAIDEHGVSMRSESEADPNLEPRYCAIVETESNTRVEQDLTLTSITYDMNLNMHSI